MHSSMMLALVASGATLAAADGVYSAVYPTPSEKAGCQYTLGQPGNLTPFAFVNKTTSGNSKRQIDTSQQTDCSYANGNKITLASHLEAGVLTDSHGRTAYIAGDNNQLQYDDPPQAGATYTAGWSVCAGGILALGDTTTFYNCDSGNLYNIYNQSIGPQCTPFNYVAISCAPGTAPTFQASKAPIRGAANLDGTSNSNSNNSSSSSSSSSMTSTTSSVSAATSSASTTDSAAPMSSGIVAPVSSAAGATAGYVPGPSSSSAAPSGTEAARVGSSSSGSSSASPSPFTGAGVAVQAAQSLVGLVAAGAAFALL